MKGSIVTWNDQQGFGFVRPEGGGNEIFVHVRAFPFYQRRPKRGDDLTYRPGTDERGRTCAKSPALKGLSSNTGAIGLLLFSVLPIIMGLAFYKTWVKLDLTSVMLSAYSLTCPVTFALYLWDKHKAVTSGYRIPEKTLHALEFFGGWPAAFFAQRAFRHKNRKVRYQLVFWFIVLLHGLFWTRTAWLPLIVAPNLL